MTRRIRYTPDAKADLAGILDWTLRHFGQTQQQNYRRLIIGAIADAAEDAYSVRTRPAGTPGANLRIIPVARRGHAASHYVLYRVSNENHILILRVLHDRMDRDAHITEETHDPA